MRGKVVVLVNVVNSPHCIRLAQMLSELQGNLGPGRTALEYSPICCER